MELLFLGTGAGLPSKQRNVTAIALTLFQERGSFWLFDCGEATQHQVIKSPLSLSKLAKVFITHLHGDHIFGLPGLLSSRSFAAPTTPLDVYGPRGLAGFIQAALDASQTHLTYALQVHEISEGPVWEDDRFTVSCSELNHTVQSFGYRVVERDEPGVLDVAALQRLGVPAGPLYGQLKRGQSIEWPVGTRLDAARFIGPPKQGRVVSILGDTRPCPAAIELAQGADMLVHEATFASDAAHLAPAYGHSTAVDAAKVASEAGVSQLLITHVSARYSDNGAHQLLSEAQAVFPATCVASDFLRVPIDRPIERRTLP